MKISQTALITGGRDRVQQEHRPSFYKLGVYVHEACRRITTVLVSSSRLSLSVENNHDGDRHQQRPRDGELGL